MLIFIAGFFTAVIFYGVNSENLHEHNTMILLKDSVNSQISDSLRLIDGRKLYKKRCHKCHALYSPKDYKLQKWKENLDEMKKKAALSDDEYDLIYLYLKTYSKK
jgi:hypothetical protein